MPRYSWIQKCPTMPTSPINAAAYVMQSDVKAGIGVRSASGATRNIAPKIEKVIHPIVTRCTTPTIHE